MTKKKIYFICTGNACRSQIAEGYAKNTLGENWNVYSGGIESHGVNPLAIEAMKEDGIDISHQTSDKITEQDLNSADLVITLCDHADKNCPIISSNVRKAHWGFEDPAGKDWSKFQEVRDNIKKRIQYFKETGC